MIFSLLPSADGFVPGGTLACIKAFLSNRQQQVKAEDEYSIWKPVKSGVPQGSVLRPILFVVFINDMLEVMQSLCQLFADHTKIFDMVNLRDVTAGDTLHQDIHSQSNWSEIWQLFFQCEEVQGTLHWKYQPLAEIQDEWSILGGRQ